MNIKIFRKSLNFVILVSAAIFLLLGFSYRESIQKKIKIVATTSLIASIVEEVGGDRVDVVSIVPFGMCPGHFDIRPGDVKLLEEASLLLEHGWEGKLFVDKMVKLVENKSLKRVKVNVEGNWMVPDIYIKAMDRITNVLCQIKPEDSQYFKRRAKDYRIRIFQTANKIRKNSDELMLNKIKVICSDMQEGFIKWMGFDIVGTYGRPEDLTTVKLKKLVDTARKEKVKLIVDNLQSGPKAGIPIAEEVKAFHITLTNFPKAYNGRLDYLKSLEENTSKLFSVCRKIRIE